MSNEIIGQYVQAEPAGFGGLFRLPRFVGGDGVLCVTYLVDECSGVWAVDDVEWCPGGCLDVVLAVVVGGDEESVEEKLVEHATDVLGGLPVGVSGVLGDVECDADEFVGLGEVGVEGVQDPGRGGEFGVRVGAKLLQSVPEECFEVVAEVGCEADAVIEVLDQVLGVLDLDGAESAVGALGVASEA